MKKLCKSLLLIYLFTKDFREKSYQNRFIFLFQTFKKKVTNELYNTCDYKKSAYGCGIILPRVII